MHKSGIGVRCFKLNDLVLYIIYCCYQLQIIKFDVLEEMHNYYWC